MLPAQRNSEEANYSQLTLPVEDPRWLEWVATVPGATLFHHPAWAGLMAGTYGFQSGFFTLLDGSGHICAGLPIAEVGRWPHGRRLVSMPFTDACEPLATNDRSRTELILKLQIWRRKQHARQLEVRWPLPEEPGVFAGATYAFHVTSLDRDPEAVFHRFKKTQVQQCIYRAQKLGVEVTRATSWQDMRAFYRLHLMTRHRLGTPVQPLRYFRLLWERLLMQGFGFLLLARAGEQLVAGAVFLNWNGSLIYKYSASDAEYWKFRPNNLLLWEAIRWGCENGYRVFDWGRTDLGNRGLREFKNGWGSTERELHYSVLADLACSSPARIPQGDLTRVIQRSPTWLCRLIGELAYRYAA